MATTIGGSCLCGKLRYSIPSEHAEHARTSLCHCMYCRKAFGTNYGLTTKVPVDGFKYDNGSPRLFRQDNGVIREFCEDCGVFICEYGEQAADKFRYILWGTFDEPEQFPPKGEFFCKSRVQWMPEIPHVFHKAEIKE
ncbi:glutathione-dependent formaldehyde-activating enzyme [Thelonectria olida]|uniref:Glutathione-dependent formaldehyde-activating enzyme n=1 Tax=Thelonectria olida TaxID=1576542 RepID=A0A9P8VYL7_9HYPO|nr:glutathione-dependent formaldehyde-activating enzyme [Thelonectria olida]